MTGQDITTALQPIKRRKKFSRLLAMFADVRARVGGCSAAALCGRWFGSTIDLRLIAREGD